MTLNDVARCSVLLVDMGDVGEMNAACESYFAQPEPADITVAVAGLPHEGAGGDRDGAPAILRDEPGV